MTTETDALKYYVGAQNDALYIIDKPPRPSNDDQWHDRPDGPNVIAKVYDHSLAQKIADALNGMGEPHTTTETEFVC